MIVPAGLSIADWPTAPTWDDFGPSASAAAGGADRFHALKSVRRAAGRSISVYVDARGRQRQLKVGPADVLSLSKARRLARGAIAEALLGADPATRRQELRSIPTLSQLVRDRYLPHAQVRARRNHERAHR